MKAVHEAIKSVSIEFAEWLSKNEWVKRDKTHPNKVGQYWSHIHCEYEMIVDLFEIFKKESDGN